MISDAEYDPAMEWQSVGILISNESLPRRLVRHETLLTRLQSIHDSLDVDEWDKALTRLAYKFGLTMPNRT